MTTSNRYSVVPIEPVLARASLALAILAAGFAGGRAFAMARVPGGASGALGAEAPAIRAGVSAPGPGGEPASLARAARAAAPPEVEVAGPTSWADLEGLLARLDAHPGPAYRRYLVDLLTRKALAEPGLELELLDRARAERDPERLAALGEALVGYYRATQDDRIPSEARAALETERDPARRRALLGFLGSMPGVALALPDFPARCAALAVEAPDAATRTAAAIALASQAAGGASPESAAPEIAGLLVDVASRTPETATAGRLLAAVDLRRAGPESVGRVSDLLDAPAPEVRRGAARALASAPPAARAHATAALARRARFEVDPEIRASLVDAIVRLDLGGARPVLAGLTGLDPALDQHIQRYEQVLALGLSEWRLVQRELNRS
ncbi:MAG: hypothetical protein IPK07_26565 [Deltaproteobacteria bacterium]|nr:hypothetical protein [Deltaproteobacteria bacterium]